MSALESWKMGRYLISTIGSSTPRGSVLYGRVSGHRASRQSPAFCLCPSVWRCHKSGGSTDGISTSKMGMHTFGPLAKWTVQRLSLHFAASCLTTRETGKLGLFQGVP